MIDHDFLEGNSKTIINKISVLKCFGLTKNSQIGACLYPLF